MAESQENPETTETEPTETPENDDAEKAYWAKMDSHLDGWFDRKLKDLRAKQPPGTKRTGRTTLPRLVAELMGGPFTPVDKD